MKKIAIFVSGRGTNMDNIIRVAKRGQLHATVNCVVTDKEHAPAIAKARRHKVPVLIIVPQYFTSKKKYEETLVAELRARKIDLVVLAGFMRILSPVFIKAYRNRILNIHPSLLPAFKGAHGIRDAYEAGVPVTGVTVHWVTEQLDSGPIVLQAAIPVYPRETCASLERRIHALEYTVYPQAITLVVAGKTYASQSGPQ